MAESLEASRALRCRECGGPLHRAGLGPSTQVVERLDNGLMPRALERLADAERLFEEREREADQMAGTTRRYYGD
jgi:hypothetical protein